RDKAHLANKSDRRVGFGKNPALLMIDLYRGVFGDEPEPLLEGMKKWPSSCGLEAWESLPHIQSLLASARESGVPVVHMTGLDEESSGMPGWGKSAWNDRKKGMTEEQLERHRRRYDIIDELSPLPGETVLHKASPSAFYGTPLTAKLAFLGTDTIVVAGESTSGCVRASVVDGATARYRMVVAEECVFDRHQATHAINLFDLNQKYADVIPVSEAVEYFNSWQPASE
ncbi:MAG: isochorismatase family protein, partial [Dehalococcoidia bacterium]